MTDEELRNLIDGLKGDIARLSVPYEDALSHRVFEGAKKKLFISATAWASAITVIVAFAGYNVYDKVKVDVSEHISKKMIPKLEEEAKKELEIKMLASIESQVAGAIKSSQKQSDAKLNQALTKIGDKFNDDSFAKKTEESIKALTDKTNSSGWSFFGSKGENDDWRNRGFRLSDDNDSEPVKGNKIKAITDVNLRSDKPSYNNDTNGWNYPPIKAVVSYGEEVTVQDVMLMKTPKGKSVWVNISRNNTSETQLPLHTPK